MLGSILRINKCSHLDLRKNILGNKGIKELAKAISTNASLVHVDIGSNDITYEGANAFFLSLRKHKTLTSISIANGDGLHRNRIGAKGCIGLNKLLKANSLISMLNISDNSIGVDGVTTLLDGIDPQDLNLISLNLSNNDLGTEWIPSLDPLLTSETLLELKLSQNHLTDKSAEDLSLYFYRQMCKLRKIDLSNNEFTSRGASLLLQSIKQNQFLTHLNIENNPSLGDGDLTELKFLLNNNENLVHLNLSNWGIEAWHIKALTEGLHKKSQINARSGNNTLHTLNLSGNRLMGEGALYLVEIIQNSSNTGLKNIDLSKNSISNEAGIAIAKALESNTTITKLSLKSNFLYDECGKAFWETLKKNKTIVKLNLDRNSIKLKYLIEIKEHLVANQNLDTQKLLPKAKEEMLELLQKEKAELDIGDQPLGN